MNIHVVPHAPNLDEMLNRLDLAVGDYLVFPNGKVGYIRQIDTVRRVGGDSEHRYVRYNDAGSLDDLRELVEKAPGLIAAWRDKYQIISDNDNDL